MAPQQGAVARALTSAPAESLAAVLVASDEVRPLSIPTAGGRSWADQLEDVELVGGQDNLPALAAAWDEAERLGGLVVWVHGPQPVLLGPVDGLRQRWERRPEGPPLVSLELAVGPNRVLEGLDGIDGVWTPVRESSIDEDLARLLSHWGNARMEVEVLRERQVGASSAASRAEAASDHLVRLWARDEITRLQVTPSGRDEAVELATRYQLVTPVSGAVVLETAEQFDRAGLTPAAAADVPTIPEPETWALVALALLAVLWFTSRRRPAWGA
jgi:hypothetical protein